MSDGIRHAALAAILTVSVAGCEHRAEKDESAERRAAVDNPIGGEDRARETAGTCPAEPAVAPRCDEPASV